MTITLPLALLACLLPVAAARACPERAGAAVAGGPRQQAYFQARLTRMADEIDRHADAGIVGRGQAAFMRQDLDRVWRGVTDDIRRAGRLTLPEEGSYVAMLRRVDLRLIQARTRRVAHRSVREQ